jgi:hypothetical protein
MDTLPVVVTDAATPAPRAFPELATFTPPIITSMSPEFVVTSTTRGPPETVSVRTSE